ncbi:protein SRG1-like [Carica papaya]|uniref:protein SRG1-like n=1 Tax=Carica papaya TaxID=3649 RepID=UPI000B8CC421|nr:protein SRG1-like [Carica papaya]
MEMEEAPTYAPSIAVLNVQEMVRRDPLHVPQRYIRSEEDRPKLSKPSHLSSQIPIIDLSLLAIGDNEELSKLDLASQSWGFFQVVNHGVAEDILNSMKKLSTEFFELPIKEKEKYSMPLNDIHGYGHAYVVSDEQLLDWSDALMLLVHPTNYRKIQFWPVKPDGFKEIIESYSNGIRKVAEQLLVSFSLIMGMKQDVILGMHKKLVQALRINYYPTCSIPDQVLGISPHSDTSTITILMQDDDVAGLQIRHNENWVSVNPIPNALVVNVGDVLEIWSNGKYKSVEHRAITNEKITRISYASFLLPHDDVDIEPLDHMINPQRPIKIYKRVKYGEYLRSSMKRKMEGKAHVDMAKY